MGVLLVSIQFFVPLFILVYCYGRILWILTRRMDSKLTTATTTTATTTRDNSQAIFATARINTVKTFLLVGICFVICWSNNQIYFLMYTLGYDADWNSIYYRFTILMIFLNCTINPFIYLIKYKDYQVALRECFNCRSKSKESEEGSTSGLTEVSLSFSKTDVTSFK